MDDNRRLLEKKIEELLGDEPYEPIEEELFKWLLYAYRNGSRIKSFNRMEFDRFKEKFSLLIESIYLRYQEIKNNKV